MIMTWNKSQNLHNLVPAWQKTPQAVLTAAEELPRH